MCDPCLAGMLLACFMSSLLCPGKAELPAPSRLWEGQGWPCGRARFSLSLEQILFSPSLPTSYWWVHNGCCVSLLSSSAFSNATCWTGEFLCGTESWSFVLGMHCISIFKVVWSMIYKYVCIHIYVYVYSMCLCVCVEERIIWLINEDKVIVTDAFVCCDVLINKSSSKWFCPSSDVLYPASSLEATCVFMHQPSLGVGQHHMKGFDGEHGRLEEEVCRNCLSQTDPADGSLEDAEVLSLLPLSIFIYLFVLISIHLLKSFTPIQWQPQKNRAETSPLSSHNSSNFQDCIPVRWCSQSLPGNGNTAVFHIFTVLSLWVWSGVHGTFYLVKIYFLMLLIFLWWHQAVRQLWFRGWRPTFESWFRLITIICIWASKSI